MVVLGACAPDEGELEARLGDATHGVRVSEHGRQLALERGGQVMLRVPLEGWQLGVVDKLSEASAYDPYWLSIGPTGGAPVPQAALSWLQPESSALASGAGSAEITLRYQDGIEVVVRLRAEAEGRFSALVEPHAPEGGKQVAYLRVDARADAGEGFYGTGGRGDSVDQRGKLRPMQMELDSALESSNDESHVPVPLLIGTRGWGLFVESRHLGAFDVARQANDLVEVTYAMVPADEPALRLHLFSAEHPLDVLSRYFDVAGRPRLPAPWATGPLLWRNETRDQAQLLDDIEQIRSRDLATNGLWLDRPYATAVNSFDFDPARFPDPAGMIAALHAAGLRVGVWSTPYLESGIPLRAQADAAGYFPPLTGLLLNGWGPPIDLTRPEAYAFWQGLIKRYTDAGIEGFKLDYAEDVVPTFPPSSRNRWKFADGSDERTMHHGYPLLYHRVYAETLPAEGGLLLCRAGRYGDQRNGPIIWPGDMDASFTRQREVFTPRDGKQITGVGGLPATVILGLTLSASGFPFFGSDTGGYRHSPPDRELFIRWLEQTALSTVMQVGDASSQMPWEFTADNGRDDATVDLYRLYARLHLRLFPYLWTHAARLATEGRPIARPLGLAYPELGLHPDDLYLLGDDLLVAPVLTRGATSREVTLPAGNWIDWWDGSIHAGTFTAPAPLDRIPLYLREGAIVPLLRPTIDTLAPTTRGDVDSFATSAGVLFARVAPPAVGAPIFTLYDGTRLAAERTPTGLTLTTVAGTVFTSGYQLELLATARPASVTLDGAPLGERADLATLTQSADGWFHDPAAGGALHLKLPAGAHAAAILP